MRVQDVSFFLLLSLTFCSGPQSSVRAAETDRHGSVKIPRVWLSAKEVLIVAHRQAALRYAVLPPVFEAPVGPFSIEEPIDLQTLIGKVAEATGTDAHWSRDVIIFDPLLDPGLLNSKVSSGGGASQPPIKTATHAAGHGEESPTGGLQRVSELAILEHSSTIPELSSLAGSTDGSTRFHSLAALLRLEGDFMRNSWPGRVSIYELMYGRLDRDALLFAMEEGGPPGGQVWKMAAEILGRAREPNLTRGVWWNLWRNRPGTLRVTLWCMGRCGDPSGLGPLRERMGSIATNDIADQYLAAVVLGRLDAVELLTEQLSSVDVDVRRAAALGLGVCQSVEEAAESLEQCFGDRDTAIQFIACQSLARLGREDRLEQILASRPSRALWVGALEALSETGRIGDLLDKKSLSKTVDGIGESEAVLLAKIAEILGRHGGESASVLLPGMLNHKDRWVRAAAAESLAKLGTSTAIDQIAALTGDAREDPEVRIAAIMGLGRSLSPEAAEPLFTVAGNPVEHYRLRHYAILSLARLARRAGHEKIESLVDPGSTGFLPFAVRHVRFESPDEAVSALVPLLTHGDRSSACAAAANLSELGYGPGVRELLEGSDIFDNHTRMMHSWGAIRSGGYGATAAMIEAGKSRRSLIRQGAALSLGGRHTPAAVDTLLQFASDPAEGVRAAAAQSLGLSADPRAIPVLIRLAETDSSQAVRTEAIRALRNRDFANVPQVKQSFARLAWTEYDAGGVDSDRPSLSQQKAHTFVLRDWAAAYEEDLITNLTYETTMCYDSHRERVIMWGSHGRRYDSPQTGQTWFFDLETNVWKRLSGSTQWPNGSCCNRQILFDTANKLAVLAKSGRGAASGGHGWLNGLRGNLSFSIPWVLDVMTDEWYPMRPVKHFGNLGMVGGSFDPRTGLNFWWRGELVAYDAYANQWLSPSPSGARPERDVNSSAVFDPLTGRLIAVGNSSTWAYDPAANRWEDLAPEGEVAPTGAPMVYDSVNDVMLALKQLGQEAMQVWVYHPLENRWEKLPAVQPAPRYGTMFDAVYDPRHNLVVISGNESMSWSGALTSRETWTYRYRPAEGKSKLTVNPLPLGLKVVTTKDGSAHLSWSLASTEDFSGFLIRRKSAENPLNGDWKTIAEVPADQRDYLDSEVPGKQLFFYSVAAQTSDPDSSLPSATGRTAIPALRWVSAVFTDRGVHVKWQPSEAEDKIGYHVYRAQADLRWPWHDVFDPAQQLGELEQITVDPLSSVEFFDTAARIELSPSELEWPQTFAYLVRVVNSWGVESGPSPVAVALPDAPGPVRVIPWLDGRRLILWSEPKTGEDLRGYHVMRMDDWHRDYVFRWQAAPVVGTAFYDQEELPRADRRRYYVSGVDLYGAIGVPSSGAWSHGLP